MADNLNSKLIEQAEIEVNEFKKKLIEILKNERKLKSDSKTINSLHIICNESSRYVDLRGVEYFYYVVHGRGPGRFPPPDKLTGEWKIPFPIAKKIAMFGNKAEYVHVGNAFDKLYDEMIKKIKKESGKIALAYILKIGTIGTVKS